MAFSPVTGSWPALWLIPTAGITDPQGEHGEIDIFEWQSQAPTTFYGNIHDWIGKTDMQNNDSDSVFALPAGTNLANYHTYGVLWTPTTISWYFDNTLMGTASAFAIFGAQSYYLIMGQQIGTDWTEPPVGLTANTLTMNVNWVHVFQQ
jgi:beta-glucanase (GH16 family)